MSKLDEQNALPRRKLFRSESEFIKQSGQKLRAVIEGPMKRKAKKAKRKP